MRYLCIALFLCVLVPAVALAQTTPGHTTLLEWSADSYNIEKPTWTCLSDSSTLSSDRVEGTASQEMFFPGDQGGYGCNDGSMAQMVASDSWFDSKWHCHYWSMKIVSMDWDYVVPDPNEPTNQHKFKLGARVIAFNDDQAPTSAGPGWTVYLHEENIEIQNCGGDSSRGTCTGGDCPGGSSPSCGTMNFGSNLPIGEWHDYSWGFKVESGVGNCDGEVLLYIDDELVDSEDEFCWNTGTSGDGEVRYGSGLLALGMSMSGQTPFGIIRDDHHEVSVGSAPCVARDYLGFGDAASPTLGGTTITGGSINVP